MISYVVIKLFLNAIKKRNLIGIASEWYIFIFEIHFVRWLFSSGKGQLFLSFWLNNWIHEFRRKYNTSFASGVFNSNLVYLVKHIPIKSSSSMVSISP